MNYNINAKMHSERVPAIKQVLPAANIVGRWLAAAENKRQSKRKRREMNSRPTKNEYEQFCSYSFSHALPVWVSVLHLSGVLSGGNEPPLCKGRWHGLP